MCRGAWYPQLPKRKHASLYKEEIEYKICYYVKFVFGVYYCSILSLFENKSHTPDLQDQQTHRAHQLHRRFHKYLGNHIIPFALIVFGNTWNCI